MRRNECMSCYAKYFHYRFHWRAHLDVARRYVDTGSTFKKKLCGGTLIFLIPRNNVFFFLNSIKRIMSSCTDSFLSHFERIKSSSILTSYFQLGKEIYRFTSQENFKSTKYCFFSSRVCARLTKALFRLFIFHLLSTQREFSFPHPHQAFPYVMHFIMFKAITCVMHLFYFFAVSYLFLLK